MRSIKPESIMKNQTWRFDYEGTQFTVRITGCLPRHVLGRIECGKDRGNLAKFEKIEKDCKELLASSILQGLHANLDSLD